MQNSFLSYPNLNGLLLRSFIILQNSRVGHSLLFPTFIILQHSEWDIFYCPTFIIQQYSEWDIVFYFSTFIILQHSEWNIVDGERRANEVTSVRFTPRQQTLMLMGTATIYIPQVSYNWNITILKVQIHTLLFIHWTESKDKLRLLYLLSLQQPFVKIHSRWKHMDFFLLFNNDDNCP